MIRFCSVGSTNQDIRSYSLNFEVSAFIYDEATTLEMQRIFEKDMADCFLLTDELIAKQSRWLRLSKNSHVCYPRFCKQGFANLGGRRDGPPLCFAFRNPLQNQQGNCDSKDCILMR